MKSCRVMQNLLTHECWQRVPKLFNKEGFRGAASYGFRANLVGRERTLHQSPPVSPNRPSPHFIERCLRVGCHSFPRDTGRTRLGTGLTLTSYVSLGNCPTSLGFGFSRHPPAPAALSALFQVQGHVNSVLDERPINAAWAVHFATRTVTHLCILEVDVCDDQRGRAARHLHS